MPTTMPTRSHYPSKTVCSGSVFFAPCSLCVSVTRYTISVTKITVTRYYIGEKYYDVQIFIQNIILDKTDHVLRMLNHSTYWCSCYTHFVINKQSTLRVIQKKSKKLSRTSYPIFVLSRVHE